MSHTKATLAGEGNLLQVKINGTYTTVAGTIEAEGPEQSREGVETFSLESTFKTKRPSKLPDADTLDFTAYFDPQDTGHQYVQTSFNNAATENWQILFVDGTTMALPGWIAKWKSTGIKVDDNVQMEVSIQPTALPVWTPGTTQL